MPDSWYLFCYRYWKTPLGKVRNLSKEWGKIQQMHAAFNLEQLCSIHVISDSSDELVRHLVKAVYVPFWYHCGLLLKVKSLCLIWVLESSWLCLLMASFCTDHTSNSHIVHHPCFETAAVTDVRHYLCYLMGQSRQMLWTSWLGKKPLSILVEFTLVFLLCWDKCFIGNGCLRVFEKAILCLGYLSYWKSATRIFSKSSRCFWV